MALTQTEDNNAQAIASGPNVIASFNGISFIRDGRSSWVTVRSRDGTTSDFSLRDLDDYAHIEQFEHYMSDLKSDEFIEDMSSKDPHIHDAISLLSSLSETLYWRKVGEAIKRHYEHQNLHSKARNILLAAGLSVDDVDGLINQ